MANKYLAGKKTNNEGNLAYFQAMRVFQDVAAVQDYSSVAGVNRQVALADGWQAATWSERLSSKKVDGGRSVEREDGRVEGDGVTALRIQQCLAQGAGATISSAGDDDVTFSLWFLCFLIFRHISGTGRK